MTSGIGVDELAAGFVEANDDYSSIMVKALADRLAEARNLHREAQLRWDFVAAENSMGFHNPEEALRILAKATDLARQAELKAVLAGE